MVNKRKLPVLQEYYRCTLRKDDKSAPFLEIVELSVYRSRLKKKAKRTTEASFYYGFGISKYRLPKELHKSKGPFISLDAAYEAALQKLFLYMKKEAFLEYDTNQGICEVNFVFSNEGYRGVVSSGGREEFWTDPYYAITEAIEAVEEYLDYTRGFFSLITDATDEGGDLH